MLEESIHAIENAENSTLIWLVILGAMFIVYMFLRLGGQALRGFHGSDTVQNTSINNLSLALVKTNEELLQTNRELSESHKETVLQMKETTAAFATLAREVRGVETIANEHYELGKVIHQKADSTNNLIKDNATVIITKLDLLIAALDTQQKHSRHKDAEIATTLQQIRHIQWLLQIRLQMELPQLALPAPKSSAVA